MARPRSVARGQSLVEFALLLPILLTLFGAITDIARLYSAWITLEGATRDAAEYAATNSKTSAAAASDALTVVCTETKDVSGFTAPPGNPTNCSQPAVTVTSYTLSTTATGASSVYPIATVTVRSTLAFSALLPLPLFTQGGAWTISSERTYSIVQGRS